MSNSNIKTLFLAAMFSLGLGDPGIWSQDLTLPEVQESLLANPPVHGDSAIRRNCFYILDRILKTVDVNSSSIRSFYNKMLLRVWEDISNPASGQAVIYKMYNHGFIVKLQDITIAFDLVPSMETGAILPLNILGSIDILMISHEHGDHYNYNTVNRILPLGCKVIIPQEMDIPGAIRLGAGDSIEISGVKIKAHDGLHSVPVRIYEVTTPLGVKIMHTGDNQTSQTLPENIEDLDILFLNSWVNESDGAFSNVTGMFNCLQKLKPRLMIPGHCHELWHPPEQRYPYDSVFTLQERHILPSEVRVMAWGEKTIYKPDAVLSIQKTDIRPKIDGRLDSAWFFIPEISMQRTILDQPLDWNDLHSYFRTMWDDENLYFFLSVRDDTLRTDNPDAWNNDVIEIFLDGDNSKNDLAGGYDTNDLQMRFEYMGESWQAPNSEFIFRQTDGGYDFETRIPSSDLNFGLTEELIIGLDVGVTDNDQGFQNTILRWWSESMENWRWPALFGTSKLLSLTNKGIANIPHTTHPLRIDGVLDDAWIGKEMKTMNHVVDGEKNLSHPGDLDIRWNAVWHKDTLYFLFEVQDDTLVADDDQYWQDDCIEFWFDGDNSKGDSHDGINDLGFQFRYNHLLGKDVIQSLGPAASLENINQAAKLTPEGWRVEMAFPLDILGIEPYDSVLFGIDMDYNDDDDGDERESKIKTYASYDTSWFHPVDWGTAMLVGSGKVQPTVHSPDREIHNLACRIYPNPVSKFLHIDLRNLSGNHSHILITNLSGMTIHNERISHIPGDLHTNINLDRILPGIYLIQIRTEYQFWTGKFIKAE